MDYNKLDIRRPKLDDSKDMFKYCSDKETTKFLSFETHKTIKDTEFAIENILLKNNNAYVITYNNICIGTIDYRKDDNNNYELGYVLNKKYHNKGIITYFAKILIDRIKENKDANIFIYYEKDNIASKRVAEKLGFIETGIKRKQKIKNKERISIESKLI